MWPFRKKQKTDEVLSEFEVITQEAVESIRPYAKSHGGDIQWVKAEEPKLYLKIKGSCASCPLIDQTLKNGVEAQLREIIPLLEVIILR